jgi:hypothetical protein
VAFYAGDILDKQTDILVVSAYKQSFYPVPGSVFGNIFQRFKRDYSAREYTRLSDNIVLFDNGSSSMPWKKMVVLEMIDSLNYDVNVLIQSRFSEFFACATSFIDSNDTSLSIPLIGTGQQKLPKEAIALELLRLAANFSNTQLKVFNIFAYGLEAVANINMKINQYLTRTIANPMEQRLVSAMSEELETIAQSSHPRLNIAIEELLSLISSKNVGINPIAMQGRIIAEIYADLFLEFNKQALPYLLEDQRLETGIKAISTRLREINKAYLLSYLRLLQSCGNMAVHDTAPRLTEMDIVAILVAVVRLAQDASLTEN